MESLHIKKETITLELNDGSLKNKATNCRRQECAEGMDIKVGKGINVTGTSSDNHGNINAYSSICSTKNADANVAQCKTETSPKLLYPKAMSVHNSKPEQDQKKIKLEKLNVMERTNAAIASEPKVNESHIKGLDNELDVELHIKSEDIFESTEYQVQEETIRAEVCATKKITSAKKKLKISYKKFYAVQGDHFICLKCTISKKFPFRDSVIRHIREKHFDMKFICPECEKSYLNSYSLKRHLKNKHNLNIDALMDNTDLNEKAKEETYDSTGRIETNVDATALECKEESVTESIRLTPVLQLNIHDSCSQKETKLESQVDNANLEVETSCNIKSTDITTNQFLYEENYKIQGNKIICLLCKNSEKFKNKTSVVRHIRIEHLNMKYVCPECKKEYLDRQGLKYHLDTVHKFNIDKLEYNCLKRTAKMINQAVIEQPIGYSIKKDQFAYKDYYKKQRNHFICLKCAKKSKHKEIISRHIRIAHFGAVFICPECKKKYMDKTSLRDHYKTKHKLIFDRIKTKCFIKTPSDFRDEEGKPAGDFLKNNNHVCFKQNYKKLGDHFICLKCTNSKKYKFRTTISRHIRIAHYGLNYICPECKREYSSSSVLKLHLQTQHNSDIDKLEIKSMLRTADEKSADYDVIKTFMNNYKFGAIATKYEQQKSIETKNTNEAEPSTRLEKPQSSNMKGVKIENQNAEHEPFIVNVAEIERLTLENEFPNNFLDNRNLKVQTKLEPEENKFGEIAANYEQQKSIVTKNSNEIKCLARLEKPQTITVEAIKIEKKNVEHVGEIERFALENKFPINFLDNRNLKVQTKLEPEETDDIETTFTAAYQFSYENNYKVLENKIICLLCKNAKEFKSRSSIVRHIRIEHFNMKYVCPECKKIYFDRHGLKRHLDAVHNLDIEKLESSCLKTTGKNSNQAESNVEAPIAFAVPTNKSIFREYYKKHGNNFICLKCSMKLAQREHIVRHIRIVHLGYKYICSDCNKEYTDKSSLRVHINNKHKLNIGELETRCLLKTTNDQKALAENIKRKAIIDNTNSFLNQNSRVLFEQNYEKQGNHFICLICINSKKYQFRRTISRHIRKKHCDLMYICPECKGEYWDRNTLMRHLAVQHQFNIDELEISDFLKTANKEIASEVKCNDSNESDDDDNDDINDEGQTMIMDFVIKEEKLL